MHQTTRNNCIHCSDGNESWCGYKRDKVNKTSTYKHGKSLPLEIFVQMKPVYVRVDDKELLRKCLDGKTLNQNESFNGMIWQPVPKSIYIRSDAFHKEINSGKSTNAIGKTAQILDIVRWIQSHVGCTFIIEVIVELKEEYERKKFN